MDLQDFAPEPLYFDQPSLPEVQALIAQAAQRYADGGADALLQRAAALAPEDLTVLVARYRFYFYQHRHADALAVAHRAMAVVAPLIGFPEDWRQIDSNHLQAGVGRSFTLVRFYLMALKGAALLLLRMGEQPQAVAMLEQVQALDANDRLGAAALLQTVADHSI
ncbi:hypothetical protein [Motiliproteus sediminis]|uniref:hypothetical protein n=1 Tax=Motiliproteus sediminis TaxID=1468178 RepID=UPI001AEFDE6C|nr:hypothetical protein [Motiliproteus sediminis]